MKILSTFLLLLNFSMAYADQCEEMVSMDLSALGAGTFYKPMVDKTDEDQSSLKYRVLVQKNSDVDMERIRIRSEINKHKLEIMRLEPRTQRANALLSDQFELQNNNEQLKEKMELEKKLSDELDRLRKEIKAYKWSDGREQRIKSGQDFDHVVSFGNPEKVAEVYYLKGHMIGYNIFAGDTMTSIDLGESCNLTGVVSSHNRGYLHDAAIKAEGCSTLNGADALANTIGPDEVRKDFEYKCREQGGDVGKVYYGICTCNKGKYKGATIRPYKPYDENCFNNKVLPKITNLDKFKELLEKSKTFIDDRALKDNYALAKMLCDRYSRYMLDGSSSETSQKKDEATGMSLSQ